MDELQITQWLVLQQVKGLGIKRLQTLLEAGYTPESLLNRTDSVEFLPKSAQDDLSALRRDQRQHLYYQKAVSIQEHAQKMGWAILPIESPSYPRLLKEIPFPPPLLYVKGRIGALQTPQVAVVGARKASQMSLDISYQWSKALASHGLAITSGLALGIDGCAHRGALAGNGITIAVLAHGLDQVYPRQHQELSDQILHHEGALVTEFAPGVVVRRDHFPRRNRIISGLSRGVLVVEAAIKSGSLITAQYALEQNREVFAVPGSLANPMTKGCHLLIKQGAHLVESPQDVLDAAGFTIDNMAAIQPAPIPAIDLPERLVRLLGLIAYDFVHVDTLVNQVNCSISDLNADIIELEVLGFVENHANLLRRIK